MSEVSFLPGASAISAFRRDRLLSALQAVYGSVKTLSCSWAYLVQHKTGEPPQETSLASDRHLDALPRLMTLLELQGPGFPSVSKDVLRLWVFPRHGTLSPWASKAMDILRRCGLTELARLERGLCFEVGVGSRVSSQALEKLQAFIQGEEGQLLFYDRMTEELFFNDPPFHLVEQPNVKALESIALTGDDSQRLLKLQAVNRRLGLALSDDEMAYLVQAYKAMNREPTDVELMMFAQANSEHCRHKIFNASFTIDSKPQEKS
ncbi:MAG: phosphoribosylformylglycinamidine synthase, partial [Burkholderiaceae bacterium]